MKQGGWKRCLGTRCTQSTSDSWAGVQAFYFWLEDPVAALPTPQSLAYRQWVVVVAAAAAAACCRGSFSSSSSLLNSTAVMKKMKNY